jgi:hypothetical protein
MALDRRLGFWESAIDGDGVEEDGCPKLYAHLGLDPLHLYSGDRHRIEAQDSIRIQVGKLFRQVA